LGYVPGKSLQMKMSVQGAPIQNNADSSISFGGQLEIQQTSGGPLTIDFSLTATCALKNGSLSITAAYDNGQYDLQVSGTLNAANSHITFDFKYTNAPGASPISFSFGWSDQDGGLKASLQLLLGPTGLQASFSISFSYPYNHAPANTTTPPATGGATPAAALPSPPAAPAAGLIAAAPGVTPLPTLHAIDQLSEKIYLGNKQVIVRKLSVFSLPGAPSYLFKAKMDVDADGAPKCYHPSNDRIALDYLANSTSDSRKYIQGTNGVGPAEGFYVSETSLQFGPDNDTGSFVDATTIPYFILPAHWRDVQPGDVGVIINWSNSALPDSAIPLTHAIFADTNPTVGEASVHAATVLGLPNTSPKNGGDDNDNYIYIVFPGSALVPATAAPHWPDADIKTKAMALFNEIGGLPAVRKIFT
jgi:Fungal chitosanase of glycosyl hydrolase group 75